MASKCSRTGCDNTAIQFVDWRNPKIHSAEKVKSWATCGEHYDYFVSYLTIRGFFLATRDFQ